MFGPLRVCNALLTYVMGRAHYKLAEGRCKCTICGKKYTHRPRCTMLSQEKQKEIARLFWLRVAAAAAARAVGLSANKQQPHGAIDLQSTYNRPRERRAAPRQAALDPTVYTVTPTAGKLIKTVTQRLPPQAHQASGRVRQRKEPYQRPRELPRRRPAPPKSRSRWLQTRLQALYQRKVVPLQPSRRRKHARLAAGCTAQLVRSGLVRSGYMTPLLLLQVLLQASSQRPGREA